MQQDGPKPDQPEPKNTDKDRLDKDRPWVADQGLELHRLIARRGRTKRRTTDEGETPHEPDRKND